MSEILVTMSRTAMLSSERPVRITRTRSWLNFVAGEALQLQKAPRLRRLRWSRRAMRTATEIRIHCMIFRKSLALGPWHDLRISQISK